MLVRNVGHHMNTDAVLDADGAEIPEGILDAVVTTLIALHDLQRQRPRCATAAPARSTSSSRRCTARTRSRSPTTLFARVEDMLGLPRNTLKMGIMDEERRTSVNLEGLHPRRRSDRVVFINTGFLDRTGDEIHTSMEAGPMVRKGEMKQHRLDQGLRGRNVDIGLACRAARPRADRQGHVGRARPDGRHAGAEDRPSAGRRQHRLGALAHRRDAARAALPPGRRGRRARPSCAAARRRHARRPADHPARRPAELVAARISQQELDNNAQGILGYVVRWIDQGVGCSKVPDIHDVGLMEDRATLRISSQHIANWLHHGVVTEEQVMATLQRMAAVVDRQNAGDPPTARWRRRSTARPSRPPATWCSRAASSRTATPNSSCTPPARGEGAGVAIALQLNRIPPTPHTTLFRGTRSIVMAGLGPATHGFLSPQQHGCPAFAGHDAVSTRNLPQLTLMRRRTAGFISSTDRPNGTLYVGATGNLPRRMWEHRAGVVDGFAKRYGLKLLVFAERHDAIADAIQREKNLKHWPKGMEGTPHSFKKP